MRRASGHPTDRTAATARRLRSSSIPEFTTPMAMPRFAVARLWLVLAVCAAVATVSRGADANTNSSITATAAPEAVSSTFQVRYPYAAALPALHAEIAQCAAVAGFSFRNNTPSAAQLARMCGAPSCGALASALLVLADAAAPTSVVSAFRLFGAPMINFCWYQRLPDESCPADPRAAYLARVRDKEAACARALGASYFDPNGTRFAEAVVAYVTTVSKENLCADECTELAGRVFYLYDRMPCQFPQDEADADNRRDHQQGNAFLFTFCNYAKGSYKYGYSYRPDWAIPSVPLEPSTTSPPPASDSSSSSDGSVGSDEFTVGSELGDVPEAVSTGATYRWKISRPPSAALLDNQSNNDDQPATLTDKPAAQQRGAIAVSTAISTKNSAMSEEEPPSAPASPVSASGASSRGRNYAPSVVVCVAAVAVLVGFLLFVERRRKRRAVQETTKLETPQDESDDRFSLFTDPLSSFSSSAGEDDMSMSSSSNTMISSIWGGSGVFLRKTIPLESIKDIRLIGTGGFGVVYLVQDVRSKRLLASKRLVKNQLTADKIATFYSEIQLVSKLEHPSIVSYVGATWTNRSDLQALFEYMDGGDLRTHLDVTPVAPWSLEKLDMAISVADALVYVHTALETPIVHRDLKSRNILLGGSPARAKLSDFGVARRLSHNQSMTTGVGTSRWLAPEVIIGGGEYDAACDIYSFGVVLSELDTHRLPFADYSAGGAGSMLPEITILSMVGLDGLRPTFSESCPLLLLQLAQDCLAYDPQQRPSAVTVASALRRIRASIV